MDWLNRIDETVLQDLDLVGLLINLVLVLIMGQFLSWHYVKYARVLSNKRKFAGILLFLAATTMMVISVVKTSLALSLGLVGALSIIRFRTPVKEPEDLAYLFLAIATGIGLGADQRMATVVMVVVILVALTVLRGLRGGDKGAPRIFVHVTTQLEVEAGAAISPETGLKRLLDHAGAGGTRVDARRVDVQEDVLNATLIVDLDDAVEIGSLITRIREALPKASVSVIEDTGFD